MAAHLLRLRLLLLAKGITTSAAGAVGRVLLGVAGLAAVIALLSLVGLVRQFDAEFVRRFAIVLGSLLSTAAFALPAMTVRRELIDPRSLRGYGLRTRQVAPLLLLLGLVGPFLLVVPLAAIPLILWGVSTTTVWTSALLVLQGLLLVRLGVVVGTALGSRPRRRRALAVLALLGMAALVVLLVVLSLNRLVPYVPETAQPFAFVLIAVFAPLRLAAISDALGWSPLGALWAAPTAAHPGDLLIVGATVTLVLATLWALAVRYGLRATRRIRVVRERKVPGFFRRSASSPRGAITARAWSYWVRDARYYVALAFLPVIPVVASLALWIGGVPGPIIALVPLPIMTLLLAWGTLHNDIAYDSTAIWAHLAAQTPGTADRLGRAVPVLVLGAALLAIGVPFTAWANGQPGVVPAILGVCLALLLGGVGVASGVSARRPYPAPRPGDGAFSYPQPGSAQDGSGFGAQAASLLLALLVAAPAAAAAWWWLESGREPWNWVSLGAGVVVGGLALLIGVRAGGKAFEAAAPELLAFTMRN